MREGVDAVVVNYRTPHDLADFLRSFGPAADQVPCRLTIVDVASTGHPIPPFVTDEPIHVILLTPPENIGYARSCNAAAQVTANFDPFDTLAFFNADTMVEPDTLKVCRDALWSQPDWGILGPRQVDQQNRITHAGMFGTNTNTRPRGWRNRDNGEFDGVRDDAITVAGSAYFVRRAVWDELTACPIYQAAAPDALGAFLPTQHYYEETACSYHARAHGWKVVYFGPARMVHKWHRASPTGGWADQQINAAREMFRAFCDLHTIERD